MPSAEVLAKRRKAEEDAKGVYVNVHLKPYMKYFHVPLDQLSQVPFFTAYIAILSLDSPWIHLDEFHPVIFSIFVQWLLQEAIWPFRDLSKPLKGSSSAMQPPASTTAFIPDITFGTLFDSSLDHNPYAMPTARMLVQAYFMGQYLKAYYFQDSVMNVIVRYLRLEQVLPPSFVHEVYTRSNTGLRGLKKLLVDAYIWSCVPPPGKMPRICSLGFNVNQVHRLGFGYYPAAFEDDVNATLRDIRTKRYAFDDNNPENPRNAETYDVTIEFNRLQWFLCHGARGRMKCRYHQHGINKPCFDLIVDNVPVTMPARSSSASSN